MNQHFRNFTVSFFTLILMLVWLFPVRASENIKDKSENWKIYGFVRSDFFAQNRNTRSSVLDLFPLYPMPKYLNEVGEDLNNTASAGLTSITTRIGLKFNSEGIFGAKQHSAIIETDFSGSSDFVLLRIRKAFSQLDWEKSRLIIGQTWHPIFVEELTPNMLSLNTGAPFQPFNRSPQIRYSYKAGKMTLTAAAIYQLQNLSTGPLGKSMQYQKDAIIPNLFLSSQYNNNKIIAGIGTDYKALRPEKTYLNSSNIEVLNTSLLHTYSGIAYFMYKQNKFSLISKTLLGQNLSEHCIIGGYIIDEDHRYIALNTFSSLAQVQYGQVHQLGLLGGYSKVLGSTKHSDSNKYTFYGFGAEQIPANNQYQYIRDMFRLTLSYTYNPKNWRLGLELDYHAANWGNLGKNANNQFSIASGDYTDACRLHAIVTYLF